MRVGRNALSVLAAVYAALPNTSELDRRYYGPRTPKPPKVPDGFDDARIRRAQEKRARKNAKRTQGEA